MKKVCAPLFAAMLLLTIGAVGLADTIRLKDGSVIKGQVVGFKDQQFVVLLGTSDRSRRSRITLYIEDVESIDFDGVPGGNNSAASPSISNDNNSGGNIPQNQTARSTPDSRSTTDRSATDRSTAENNPLPRQNNYPRNTSGGSTNDVQPVSSTRNPSFFQINTRVRGDNAANGWTNTGLVVRKGQRLRVSATGRVGMGNGRFATPAGLPVVPDNDKLMRNEATGALIAVISDDNDDFILIGPRREFTAQRDGVLFLGVNEGNLNDNTGAYEVVIEAEAK
jgi:hypothetical protein